MHYVYVQDKDGNALMPTTRCGWVRRALDTGKAKPVQTVPFTIRLTYAPAAQVTQPVVLGMDPGRDNIGLAAVREETGECLYAAHCETRNREIPRLMEKRRQHRQASRRGERLARKRLARKLGTTMKAVCERLLPGYEEPVRVKDIINTEARFNNRRRPAGWLTPTATQLLRTHINLVRLVRRILPITRVSLELNEFAFMELEAGHKLKPEQYRSGPLNGFVSIGEAVEKQQDGVCLLCRKRPVERLHHIVPRHRNGSDTIANLAGLCEECHVRVHNDINTAKALEAAKTGLNKKYHALSVINQIIPGLKEALESEFGDTNCFFACKGYETKQFREKHKLAKAHFIDAYCIACISIADDLEGIIQPDSVYEIAQFRRHDRALIKRQTERVYKLDSTIVAKNRRKRTDQKADALADWYESAVQRFGRAKANRMRSQLTVAKSRRYYNVPGRQMPGAVFLFEGKRYVMSGQLTGGKYLRAIGCGTRNFPANRCETVSQNRGLVYTGVHSVCAGSQISGKAS